MRINQLHIKNFKGFEDKFFEFPEQVTVLIGDNATGKSSILDALAVAAGTYLLGIESFPAVQIRSIKKEEIRSIYYEDGNEEKQGIVEIEATGILDGEKITWKRTLESEKGKTTTKSAQKLIKKVKALEVKHNEGKFNRPIIAYYGTGRLWAEHNQKQNSFSNNFGYIDCLTSKSSVKEFIAFYQLIDKQIGRDNSGNSILTKICENSILAMIEGGVSMHYSHHRQDIIFTIKNKTTGNIETKPFKQLSDGYRSMISLVADIAFRSWAVNSRWGTTKEYEGIVLIDEIDLHLHPNWQRHVISDLKRVFPKIQFIITTHSPFIVQELNSSELINLEGGEPGSDPWRKSIEDIAEDEMNVQNVQRSTRFQAMEEVAAKYYTLIEQGKTSQNSEDVAFLKQQLDDLELVFNDDPAYVALLKAERKSTLK
ncbi:MAG: hypothetical protein RLZZ292_3500 [Bacteroidota bacterium]|jgi:predicted ATP-binding protein involved in virulence